MTDDAWFGVTPEPVAKYAPRSLYPPHRVDADLYTRSKIAEHVAEAAPASKPIIIDAFTGAGGNAIAFALSGKWKRVYGIEKDPAVLQCAKHNAKIYGVADKITWFEGDCMEILKNQLKELAPYSVLFASPPWGGMSSSTTASMIYHADVACSGPGYRTDEIFNLSTMQPYSIETLYTAFSAFTEDMVLFLPRTSDVRQLAAIVKPGKKSLVMHYCMDGASKALCIYAGNFTFN